MSADLTEAPEGRGVDMRKIFKTMALLGGMWGILMPQGDAAGTGEAPDLAVAPLTALGEGQALSSPQKEQMVTAIWDLIQQEGLMDEMAKSVKDAMSKKMQEGYVEELEGIYSSLDEALEAQDKKKFLQANRKMEGLYVSAQQLAELGQREYLHRLQKAEKKIHFRERLAALKPARDRLFYPLPTTPWGKAWSWSWTKYRQLPLKVRQAIEWSTRTTVKGAFIGAFKDSAGPLTTLVFKRTRGLEKELSPHLYTLFTGRSNYCVSTSEPRKDKEKAEKMMQHAAQPIGQKLQERHKLRREASQTLAWNLMTGIAENWTTEGITYFLTWASAYFGFKTSLVDTDKNLVRELTDMGLLMVVDQIMAKDKWFSESSAYTGLKNKNWSVSDLFGRLAIWGLLRSGLWVMEAFWTGALSPQREYRGNLNEDI